MKVLKIIVFILVILAVITTIRISIYNNNIKKTDEYMTNFILQVNEIKKEKGYR